MDRQVPAAPRRAAADGNLTLGPSTDKCKERENERAVLRSQLRCDQSAHEVEMSKCESQQGKARQTLVNNLQAAMS